MPRYACVDLKVGGILTELAQKDDYQTCAENFVLQGGDG
jgi:hypothetical protein